MILTKSDKIKQTLKTTKQRRLQQDCKVFEIKFLSNKLNETTKTQLKQLFIEAKWLYNLCFLNQISLKSILPKLKLLIL